MTGSVPRRRYKVLLFDVDGTLYRQNPVRLRVLWRLLRTNASSPRHAIETLRILWAYRNAQEILRKTPPEQPALPADQYRFACQVTGASYETVVECVHRWFDVESLPFLARFARPGLREFLEAARQRGLKLGVFSDYDADHKLRAMGIRGYFDIVISAQDSNVQRFKPSPIGLVVAASRLGVMPPDALYIGDRESVDDKAAAAAGMHCILINSHGGRANTVRSFEELRSNCGF